MPSLLGNLRGEVALKGLTSASSGPSERVRVVDLFEEGEDALLGDRGGARRGARRGFPMGFPCMYRYGL